jgi:ABC-type sugar transport system permease subunit
VGSAFCIFGLAIFLSAVLQRKLVGKKFFRALIFLPNVIPAIGIGLIWQFVYNYNWGPLSELLRLIGLEKLDRAWLGADYIIQSLTAAVIWTYVGFYVIILLAGIDKIPKDYYEAAVLDGATEWKMFFLITLPMIWDVLAIALVLWVVASLKIFDIIAATTFPNPTTTTYTLTIYIWATALGMYAPVFRLGYATAIGVVLLLLVVASVAIIRFITRREAIEY